MIVLARAELCQFDCYPLQEQRALALDQSPREEEDFRLGRDAETPLGSSLGETGRIKFLEIHAIADEADFFLGDIHLHQTPPPGIGDHNPAIDLIGNFESRRKEIPIVVDIVKECRLPADRV